MDFDGLEEGGAYAALGARLEGMSAQAGESGAVVAEFTSTLKALRAETSMTQREVSGLGLRFGSSMKRAFDGVIFDGDRLSDALRSMGNSMMQAAYSSAMRPVQNGLGNALAGAMSDGARTLVGAVLPFAKGGAISQGRVMGGVSTGATSFGMRGATGIMGEAGPEAVMPLTRGADGTLGVRSQGGGGGVTVNMNISTPDAVSFRRSKGQVAAELSRAVSLGQRNM